MTPSRVLADVERRLRDLWAEPARPGESPRTRVCTMNLVVVTDAVDVAERYMAVVDEVTRGVPARAIVVELRRDGEDGLAAEVSAVCSTVGGRDVCSERIHLVARGAVSARVGSAVEALRVPELPTALVWLGRVHVGDPVFLDLARDVQRLVLDTEYTSLASLVEVARWARAVDGAGPLPLRAAPRHETRPSVADLAWTRLAPWQELCARFFDEPALAAHAGHVTRVVVEQAADSGAPVGSEAALLVGWMATRLGWARMPERSEGADQNAGARMPERSEGADQNAGARMPERSEGADQNAGARMPERSEGADQNAGARMPERSEGAQAALCFVRPDGGVVALHFRAVPRPSGVAPAALARVELEASVGGVPMRGTIERELASGLPGATVDADVLVWRLEADVPCATERRVRLGANRGARLLERTLHRPAIDPALEESVAFAEDLLEHEMVNT